VRPGSAMASSGMDNCIGVDQALVRDADFLGDALEVGDGVFIDADGDLFLQSSGLDHSSGHRERRTPVRRGLSAERNAAVAREAALHWGAALPASERAYARALAGAAWPGL